MTGKGSSTCPPTLVRLWRRWTAIVTLFARQRRARHRVDPAEYRTLHRELMDLAQELARTSQGSEKAFYEYLTNLIPPWLTLEALTRSDREILLDLLTRCQQVEERLTGRRWLRVVRSWSRPVVFLAVIAALVFLGIQTADWIFYPALDWVREQAIVLRWTIRRSGNVPWLVLIGVLVVVIGIYVVSRTTRS